MQILGDAQFGRYVYHCQWSIGLTQFGRHSLLTNSAKSSGWKVGPDSADTANFSLPKLIRLMVKNCLNIL